MITKIFLLIGILTMIFYFNAIGFCQDLEPLSEERYNQIVEREDKITISSGFREETALEKELIYLTDFPALRPIDLLRFLATRPYGFVSIAQAAPSGWVSKQDVSKLMKYIESKQPVSPVINNTSEFIPTKSSSTVGLEAMCIISFYAGQPYPGECNNYYYTKSDKQEEMVNEYQEWWSIENKTE